MSRALETALDSQEILPGAYVLEISSPGISRQLSSEREFQSFKGFPVMIAKENRKNGAENCKVEMSNLFILTKKVAP